ncbi:hypothetical protein OU792_04920 [Algoriphagus sp. NF]|jgi:Predicted transcriptional regulator|uniref:type IV toxin-antitoxin system AbiEi family antitoxin domain-containing protein n=1 Tax=Algoriphagus sp. NF TaxID=2992756 RepID=UPI00106563C5|nr:hypothetical protein [Algoriphagus sp. NF]MDE0559318.1 hypothetical protein [Algoriphagus sp. NF]
MNELLALKGLGNFPLATSAILPLLRDYRRPYDKINYWVKSGDLVQIKKGLYVLGKRISDLVPHPFLLANQLYGPSYISLESALSFHGLIPERVYQTSSVTTRPSKTFQTDLGVFDYIHVKPSYFSLGLSNLGNPKSGFFIIAKPEKAIWDKIVFTSGILFRSKIDVARFLEDDLRINLSDLTQFDLEEMKSWIPFSPKKSSLSLFTQTLEQP